jgi:hypothetical protein
VLVSCGGMDWDAYCADGGRACVCPRALNHVLAVVWMLSQPFHSLQGGGAYNDGTLDMTSCTITGNTAVRSGATSVPHERIVNLTFAACVSCGGMDWDAYGADGGRPCVCPRALIHVLAVMWMMCLTFCARIMWWHGLGCVLR